MDESIRLLKFEEVYLLQAVEGLTLESACKKAGITPTTWRRWKETSPEAIPLAQQILAEKGRAMLFSFLERIEEINRMIMNDAVSPFSKPADRVLAARYINEQIANWSRVMGIDPSKTNQPPITLTGPNRTPGQSRLTAEISREITVTEHISLETHPDSSESQAASNFLEGEFLE